MTRLYCLAALAAVAGATGADAQSEAFPTRAAVSVSGSYAGVVSGPARLDLVDYRAPGLAVDATYGRLSVGAAAAFYRDDTPVDLAVGVHLARDPAAQLATTAAAALQFADDAQSVAVVTLSHGRRAFGDETVSVVPTASAGLVASLTGGLNSYVAPVVSGGVALVVGRGQVRALVTPTVAWVGGGDETVSAGVTAGLAVGWR